MGRGNTKKCTREEIEPILIEQRKGYPAAMERAREKIAKYMDEQKENKANYIKNKKKNGDKTRSKSIKDMLHYIIS